MSGRRGPYSVDKNAEKKEASDRSDQAKKEVYLRFGSRVKALRRAADITQQELSLHLGYDGTGMISQIENGQKGMSPEKALELAKFFNVTLDTLYNEDNKSTEDLRAMVALNKLQQMPAGKRKNYEAILLLLGINRE